MDNKFNHIITTKIVLGDNSQYLFLKWLLGDKYNSKFNNQPVLLIYGNRFRVEFENEYWVIITNRLLPNEILFIVDESWDITDLHVGKDTTFLICEGFPYQKENINSLICRLRYLYSNNDFMVVLVKELFEHASTDVDNPEKALQAAKVSYQNSVNDVKIVDRENDIYYILGYIPTYTNIGKNNALSSLADFENLIENLKQLYEMEMLMCFWEAYSYTFTLDICSFKSIEKSKSKNLHICIWNAYTKAAQQNLFNMNSFFVKKLIEFYKDKLTKIHIIVWDLDKDAEVLLNILKQAFIVNANKSRYGKKYKNKEVIIKSKNEFAIIVGDKEYKNNCFGINADFGNFVDEFISKTCLQILLRRMKTQYYRMEEILNE